MKIIKIGRSSSNDININDPLVSRVHCQIIHDDYGNFRLIDVNSKNGTFINGTKRHGEVRLNTSDIVRIGNTTLPWQTYFNNVGGTDIGGRGTCVTGTGYQNGGIDNGNNINVVVGGNNNGTGNPGPINPPTPKPSNFLVWAILSTIFCCMPFGIVSIVYASKVDGLWYACNYREAQEASSKAFTWFWWSFATGLILNIIILVLYFTGAIVSFI